MRSSADRFRREVLESGPYKVDGLLDRRDNYTFGRAEGRVPVLATSERLSGLEQVAHVRKTAMIA